MSNLSNMSPLFRAFTTRCEGAASAIALGKDVMTPLALDYAKLCFEDQTLAPKELQNITTDVYADHVRAPAERYAAAAGRPLKEQSEKSRRSQVSKLAAYAKLGFRARENAAVLPVLDYAATTVGSGYTALNTIAVALVDALVKNRQASEDDLLGVVQDNLPAEKAATTPEGWAAKQVRAVEKAKDGTKTEPGILFTVICNDDRTAELYDVALAALRSLHERLAEIAPPAEDPLA